MTSRTDVHVHPPARASAPRGHMHDAQPPPRRAMTARKPRPDGHRAGALGGSNRLLSARDAAAILAVPERTVRDKWREWQLPAYRIGRHLRWKERDVYAWIDRQAA
jgi:excisionase family DNA binding protein